jgi:hypothetical protein
MAGMSGAIWAPDSRRILTISSFNVRLTIWSLIDRSNCYIVYPKFADRGITFTSNGAFMALAERKDSKDHLGIYYTADWTLVSHFQLDSYDLQDILWTKDNTALVIIDSILESKFYVYSPTGSLIAMHEPYSLSLGIKAWNFSPNGHYLSIGFYDQALRIYNHITWKLIIDLPHPQSITDLTNVNIFKEEEVGGNLNQGGLSGPNLSVSKFSQNIGNNQNKTTKFVEIKNSIKFNVIKPNMDKPFPSIGVGEISWSHDSNFVASKNGKKINS